MKNDSISRQAAIDALGAEPMAYTEYEQGLHDEWIDAKENIQALPSAQPEIIHCESCEHWKNEHICECLSRYGTFETPKDFYCGYGKEKR